MLGYPILHHHFPVLIPCYLRSAQHDFIFHSVLLAITLSVTPLFFISFIHISFAANNNGAKRCVELALKLIYRLHSGIHLCGDGDGGST